MMIRLNYRLLWQISIDYRPQIPIDTGTLAHIGS